MKGSFTVELSLLFPLIFVILLALMQCGLYFTYRIYTVNAMEQSLMVCEEERKGGKTPEEAAASGEEYLYGQLERLPIELTAAEYTQSTGWLKEEYEVKISAKYTFIISLSWSAVRKEKVINPVQLRNRLDFIWEKGQQYMGMGETGQ